MTKSLSLLVAALVTIATVVPAARAQDKPDIYTLSGELLGFYYALDEYDKGMCGPLDSGPYGTEPALAFLKKYTTADELAEVRKHVRDNEAKDRAYFRDILAKNFRKRMNSTIKAACNEFTPIYLNLLKEAQDAVTNFRR